jgi:hypothetical protein
MSMHKPGLFLLGLALSMLFVACGEAATTTPPTPVTSASTPGDTAHATPMPTKDASAVATIGMGVTAFTGAYGAPTKSDATAGTYSYATDAGTLDVTVRTKEPGHNLVLSVLVTPHTTWTIEQATAQCLALAPKDAKRQKTETFTNNGTSGVQGIYRSITLAGLVPKEEFLDSNLNPTPPGTFGLVLNDDGTSESAIASCSAQIGLQGV